MNPFYVTTPIYYVNSVPHLGHAYTTIAADVLARFWRLDGRQVRYITGTDEHGQKIATAAAQHNLTPQEYVNQVAQTFHQLIECVNATPDDFIRTTQSRHKETATAVWRKLVAGGHIYPGTYAGWYAVRDEAYYKAEECTDGLAPTGAPVTWVEEKCYFFRLSRWQEPLLDFYEKNPDFIEPASRRNEVVRFVSQGLEDLCVSRSTCQWGIPVPGEPDHVMYVWLDALINYLTALDYTSSDQEMFQTFWPHALHLLGKDILRFHGVYWPAFLMAAQLPPPQKLFAHGWWVHDTQKMSKSLGNTVDPFALIKEFGCDAVRYFLMREIPFGEDGNFSLTTLKNRINSDLANDLGNLVQRVLTLVHKACAGYVPSPGPQQTQDEDILSWVRGVYDTTCPLVAQHKLHRYLEHLWRGITLGNQYIEKTAPWALKGDKKRLDAVLYNLLELIRIIGVFLQPVMPQACEEVLNFLNVDPMDRTFKGAQKPLIPQTLLAQPGILFPRRP